MKKLRGSLLLLLTAMIWGAAFVAQNVGMDYIGPFTFLCSRSILGGLVLLPVILFRKKHASDAAKKGDNRTLLLGGIACGCALFLGSILQQIGMQDPATTSGKAGFLTALYMVLIPIAGLFLGQKPRPRVWCTVLIALAGMYFLCLYEGGFSGISWGDMMELACALGFTVHILVIDRFSPRVDGVKMSCIQFFVCGALSFLGMLIFEPLNLSALLDAALPICYAGILSSGVGYTLQIVAQKDTDPTVAALIMSLESVFSLVFGWILLHEHMTAVQLLGCGLILGAIIWVQLPEKASEPPASPV